jgi:hypothetical protein
MKYGMNCKGTVKLKYIYSKQAKKAQRGSEV